MSDVKRRRVRHAYAHLVAAVEKLRAELEAQALGRCRLLKGSEQEVERKGGPDDEARRAFESYRDVDFEAMEHVQLAREALRLARRKDAGETFAFLQDRAWDDREPEEILDEAVRRRKAQDVAVGTRGERPSDFDLDGDKEA